MLLLLGFAFLAGLATILAPCVWPILPIILASSTEKGKMRPIGISLGVILSFAIFTLSISYLVKIFHFDPNVFRYFVVFIIGFLGLSMVVPRLSKITEKAVSRLSSFWGTKGQSQENGFMPGFITGLSLGIVWSPCAGPILASIAALAATGQVTSSIVLITFAYAFGAGVPLLILSLGGQTILSKSRGLSTHTEKIQKAFGVLMILAALAILTNFDKTLSASLLNKFPQFSALSTGFENNQAVTTELNKLKGGQTTEESADLTDKGPAPDFIGLKWLNPNDQVKISDLKGKVVLVDFWTYSCINCIRTIPFLNSWYDKYKDQGLVIIGIHTPEFEFEKKTDNVQNAVSQYGIKYPVAQDNNYATWTNYNNRTWPGEYLIDAKGNIRFTHFSDQNLDKTEVAIQELLKESGARLTTGNLTQLNTGKASAEQTPETYLGSKRAQFYFPDKTLENSQKTFSLSKNLPVHSFSLGGNWTIKDDQIISGGQASLNLHFKAKKVFLVLRPPDSGGVGQIRASLDGQEISKADAGSDVKDGLISVDSDRLYTLIDLKGDLKEHILKLDFQTPGTKAFAFTFGS